MEARRPGIIIIPYINNFLVCSFHHCIVLWSKAEAKANAGIITKLIWLTRHNAGLNFQAQVITNIIIKQVSIHYSIHNI